MIPHFRIHSGFSLSSLRRGGVSFLDSLFLFVPPPFNLFLFTRAGRKSFFWTWLWFDGLRFFSSFRADWVKSPLFAPLLAARFYVSSREVVVIRSIVLAGDPFGMMGFYSMG